MEDAAAAAAESAAAASATTAASSDPYSPAAHRFSSASVAAASSYFGSAHAAAALGPYAAYQNMMSMNWNSYSMASFQSLQRAGVTYGEHTDSEHPLDKTGLGVEK